MSCEDEVLKIGKKLEKMISNNTAVSIHACSSCLPFRMILKKKERGGGNKRNVSVNRVREGFYFDRDNLMSHEQYRH